MSFQSTGYCNEEYINNEKCYKMVEFNELQNAENFYKTYVWYSVVLFYRVGNKYIIEKHNSSIECKEDFDEYLNP